MFLTYLQFKPALVPHNYVPLNTSGHAYWWTCFLYFKKVRKSILRHRKFQFKPFWDHWKIVPKCPLLTARLQFKPFSRPKFCTYALLYHLNSDPFLRFELSLCEADMTFPAISLKWFWISCVFRKNIYWQIIFKIHPNVWNLSKFHQITKIRILAFPNIQFKGLNWIEDLIHIWR